MSADTTTASTLTSARREPPRYPELKLRPPENDAKIDPKEVLLGTFNRLLFQLLTSMAVLFQAPQYDAVRRPLDTFLAEFVRKCGTLPNSQGDPVTIAPTCEDYVTRFGPSLKVWYDENYGLKTLPEDFKPFFDAHEEWKSLRFGRFFMAIDRPQVLRDLISLMNSLSEAASTTSMVKDTMIGELVSKATDKFADVRAAMLNQNGNSGVLTDLATDLLDDDLMKTMLNGMSNKPADTLAGFGQMRRFMSTMGIDDGLSFETVDQNTGERVKIDFDTVMSDLQAAQRNADRQRRRDAGEDDVSDDEDAPDLNDPVFQGQVAPDGTLTGGDAPEVDEAQQARDEQQLKDTLENAITTMIQGVRGISDADQARRRALGEPEKQADTMVQVTNLLSNIDCQKLTEHMNRTVLAATEMAAATDPSATASATAATTATATSTASPHPDATGATPPDHVD